MGRWKCIVRIALLASAASCSAGQADGDLGAGEAEAKSPDWSKVKHDAGPADAPAPDASVPRDGGDPGPSGFPDACLVQGMTLATFNATGGIDPYDEGVTAARDLPFGFTLYGTSHTRYWITTNGQLGFGATPGGSAFGQVSCPLADARFTTPILLAYSADLIVRRDAGTGVCIATTGTAPNRKLVVTWKDLFFYDAWLTSHVTFSAILDEGTNDIDVVIDRVDAPTLPALETGAGAALGKQSGSSASTYSCFQARAPRGTVIHYDP